ncbi:hypothetical protein AAC387_Pa05g3296 [Persea americana]
MAKPYLAAETFISHLFYLSSRDLHPGFFFAAGLDVADFRDRLEDTLLLVVVEYDHLLLRSSPKPAHLRLFLFPINPTPPSDAKSDQQWFLDALNSAPPAKPFSSPSDTKSDRKSANSSFNTNNRDFIKQGSCNPSSRLCTFVSLGNKLLGVEEDEGRDCGFGKQHLKKPSLLLRGGGGGLFR